MSEQQRPPNMRHVGIGITVGAGIGAVLFAITGNPVWVGAFAGVGMVTIGVAIQTVAMPKTKVLPRWQLGLLLVGVLFVGFPDGAEIINLTAATLMAVALFPYGLRLVSNRVGRPAA